MRRTERAAYRTKFYSNLSPPTRFYTKASLNSSDHHRHITQLIKSTSRFPD